MVLLSVLMSVALADISVHHSSSTSPEPLTTEKSWAVAPDELNPHLKNWVLGKSIAFDQLITSKNQKGERGIKSGLLRLNSVLHFRSPGPNYSQISEFSCASEPDDFFSTQQGAQKAGEEAVRLWGELVSNESRKLQFFISKILEPTDVQALNRAQLIFEHWKDGLMAQAVNLERKTRALEWSLYLADARTTGVCQKNSHSKSAVTKPMIKPRLGLTLEDPSEIPRTQLLARLPAKRWSGLYSVRISLLFGGNTLSGRFLIDPGQPRSTASPDWLRGQGVNPQLLASPGSSVSAPVSMILGGHFAGNFRINLLPTEFLRPPRFFGTCCDGVLGADVLRSYAAEFVPSNPPAVVLYSRDGFSLGRNSPWVEVRALDEGTLVSPQCELKKESAVLVQRLVWNFRDEHGVRVPSAAGNLKDSALNCGNALITELPEAVPSLGKELSAGMELLGRASFTLDLGHGRIWFSRDFLNRKILKSHSGIRLEFKDHPREGRALYVVASPLGAQVKAGQKIETIDGLSAFELDQWDVDQRLSGTFGSVVKLQWKMGKSLREVGITVR